MFSFDLWRNLWNNLWNNTRRKQLKDMQYDYLFDPAPFDEYVSLDCETTSLDPKTAELLSIAAVRVVKGRIVLSERLELIVKPQGHIDPRTIPIHGLRRQDVSDGLLPQEALRQLLQFIGSRPLIGYYVEFDLAVINRYLKPWLGISLPQRSIEVSGLYYDKHVSAYRPEVDLTLDAILRQLDLPNLPRHNALFDAVTAAMIWLKLDFKKIPSTQ